MPSLSSGPYKFDLRINKVLGDIGDRSIAGVEYSIHYEIDKRKMMNSASTCVNLDLTVKDEAPDDFYRAIEDALINAKTTVHNTIDGLFSIGIYPTINLTEDICWHTLPCEPIHFVGDPENVFKIILCINAYNGRTGSGISLVLPCYRHDIELFTKEYIDAIFKASKVDGYLEKHFFRWFPQREGSIS